MSRQLATILLMILLSLPTVARATTAIAVEAETQPDPKPKERRTEVDIGKLVGAAEIGTLRPYASGLQVNVGRRFGDIALLAEYNYLSIGRNENIGTLSRVGVTARYSLLRTSGLPDDSGHRGWASGDFWIEGGAGAQRVAWNEGGRLMRPDAVLGFGVQLNVVVGKDTPKPRYIGPYIAFRTHLSRGPDHGAEVMPGCGAVCDTATRPSRNNVGTFFHLGINWGG